jgi:hypothetical protein
MSDRRQTGSAQDGLVHSLLIPWVFVASDLIAGPMRYHLKELTLPLENFEGELRGYWTCFRLPS